MHKTPKELGFVYDEGGDCGNRWALYKCIERDRDYSEDFLSECLILMSECVRLSFRKADCCNVAWFWSRFEECDFSDANLFGADFRSTAFTRCRFDRTNLRLAELRGAEFIDCTFEDADVRDARVGYLQSLRMGWSEKQRKEAKRSLLGWVKAPPGG
jgi:hypothetical protein